jgi:hypothetical protein
MLFLLWVLSPFLVGFSAFVLAVMVYALIAR